MLSAREAKQLRALARREGRADSGLFATEGTRVVEDLIDSPLTIRMVVVASSIEDTARGRDLLRAAARRGLDVRTIPDNEFERFAMTESPQRVLAVAEIPDFDLETVVFARSPCAVLVLDGVQDPGNFGTLVRSAEAFGVSAVVALSGTVDPWNPKSVRAAAGSSFRIPIVHADWGTASRLLGEAGFAIWGASMEGEPPPTETPDRLALVMGNEGAGLSRAVRSGLDRLVSIPTPGRAESLNVAAAAAILLYEVTR